MTALDRYLAERRICRQLVAVSLDPETDRDVAAREMPVTLAAEAAYAAGYTSEQLIAAEDRDRKGERW